MERKRVVALVIAFGVAAWVASGASAQDTKPGGPYGLPLLADVKDKCKTTDEEAKKLDEIYATAAKNETESKARAKESGTDRKAQESFATIAKNETINKIKEALDKEKGKIFDGLCRDMAPAKKKK